MTNSYSVGQCLTNITSKPQQDPRQTLHPLDAWRKTLAARMHVGGNIGADVYYLTIQAISYRFECILCRLIRRYSQQSHHTEWSEWAKHRLHSAILELDTIARRVLASGNLLDFPISLYVRFIFHYPDFPTLFHATGRRPKLIKALLA